jgi:hypothetical protein
VHPLARDFDLTLKPLQRRMLAAVNTERGTDHADQQGR